MPTEVIVIGLVCGVRYIIVAGGTLNGDLVGPRRFIASISTSETCKDIDIDYVDGNNDDDDDNGDDDDDDDDEG